MADFKKPTVQLVGEDGNVFNLIGICARALTHAGYSDKAQEFKHRVMAAGSYSEALAIMLEYVEEKHVAEESQEVYCNDCGEVFDSEDLNTIEGGWECTSCGGLCTPLEEEDEDDNDEEEEEGND